MDIAIDVYLGSRVLCSGNVDRIQIFCADACESDTPAILPFGSTKVSENCLPSSQCPFAPDAGTLSVVYEGCGGGGSGGGAAAASSGGTGSVGAGGGAGTYAIVKQTSGLFGINVQVGVGAAAGAAGANGATGTSTETPSFTWGAGQGGAVSAVAATILRPASGQAAAFSPGTNIGTYFPNVRGAMGEAGHYTNPVGWAGNGASSPLGTGGQGTTLYVTTTGAAGSDGFAGTGKCSGGSGAIDATAITPPMPAELGQTAS